MRYTSDSWSVELPAGWVAEETPECVLFFNAEDERGAFQISSYFKGEEDDQVSMDDLAQFVGDVESEVVSINGIKGLSYCQVEEGYQTWFWSLAQGPELIYISYSCAQTDVADEAAARDSIIQSLRAWH